MKNNVYCFIVENYEFKSFLSFCKVNNIAVNSDNYLAITETEKTFVFKNNEITSAELLNYDCYDWDEFVEEYYSDLFNKLSTKDIIAKLKSDGYSFDGQNFICGDFSLDPEHALGCLDSIHYDLLEIIFESNKLIGHPEKSVTKSKSYLDFNPFK